MTRFRINDNLAAVDCDGVLLDFDRCFARVASDVLGRPVRKLCSAYALVQRYGLTKPEFDRCWAALDDHPLGWSGMHILPGAAEAITKLKSYGLKVHLVTGIENRLAETRLANLLLHGIEVDGIDCVGDGHASKVKEVACLAPVMFIDDRLRLLHESDFVPDRVWVDHGDEQDGHEVDESIIRVASLAQWVDQWSLRHGITRPTRHLRCVK